MQIEILKNTVRLRGIPAEIQAVADGTPAAAEITRSSKRRNKTFCGVLKIACGGEDIRCLEEMQLDKLCCDLPQVWTSGQLDFMRRFARAWFVRQLTAAPDYGNPAAALVMFHHAGLAITAELPDIWTRHADCLPALPAFVETWAALPVGGKQWRQAFYLPAAFNQAFAQWFAQPATRAAFHTALETALLENQAPADEIPLWECCYDWLENSTKAV